MVVQASLFACVGTAGQRCTTLRRLVSGNKANIQYGRASQLGAYRQIGMACVLCDAQTDGLC